MILFFKLQSFRQVAIIPFGRLICCKISRKQMIRSPTCLVISQNETWTPAFTMLRMSIRTLILLLLMLTITSSLTLFPHHLAYFNEIAGGPTNGHKHLLGSNLDWGQDLLFLRAWMNDRNLTSRCVHLNMYLTYSGRALLSFEPESESDCQSAVSAMSVNRLADIAQPISSKQPIQDRPSYTLWIFKRR